MARSQNWKKVAQTTTNTQNKEESANNCFKMRVQLDQAGPRKDKGRQQRKIVHAWGQAGKDREATRLFFFSNGVVENPMVYCQVVQWAAPSDFNPQLLKKTPPHTNQYQEQESCKTATHSIVRPNYLTSSVGFHLSGTNIYIRIIQNPSKNKRNRQPT